MLHQFISSHSAEIGARANALSHARRGAFPVDPAFDHGVSVFLGQLSETLRLEGSVQPFSATAIGTTAGMYGE